MNAKETQETIQRFLDEHKRVKIGLLNGSLETDSALVQQTEDGFMIKFLRCKYWLLSKERKIDEHKTTTRYHLSAPPNHLQSTTDTTILKCHQTILLSLHSRTIQFSSTGWALRMLREEKKEIALEYILPPHMGSQVRSATAL